MEIRRAVADDARGIAQVHVKSWQAAYRGLLPQSYLDALSVEQREAFWVQVIPGVPSKFCLQKWTTSSPVGSHAVLRETRMFLR
jgi:hypothetical protein